jgi:GNAT superfamily N-acetyltransferase
MVTITVRQATPEDAPELARLLDLFDRMGATPEQVAARMLACQNVLMTLIGEMDGQPVGFACLRLVPHLQGDEPYAELTDIYVDAPFRRQGVARALIAQVEAAAWAAGASEVVLLTGFDNEGAQAAYRASGYANWALAMRKRFPDGGRG